VRRLLCLSLKLSPFISEDVTLVGETIEQRTGEPLGGEHGGPLVEGQVAGDDSRAALVARWLKTSNSNSAPVWDSGTCRVGRGRGGWVTPAPSPDLSGISCLSQWLLISQ